MTFQKFTGFAKSINLISEPSFFCDLARAGGRGPIKQTLSIHDSGAVYFNEYYLCIEPDDKPIVRHRYKIGNAIAQGIIDEIVNYFKSCDEIWMACDAGIWELKINTIDDKHFVFAGSLIFDNPRLNVISQRIRHVLDNKDVWAFDGALEKNHELHTGRTKEHDS